MEILQGIINMLHNRNRKSKGENKNLQRRVERKSKGRPKVRSLPSWARV